MKKILISAAVVIAIIIGCKTNSDTSNSKKIIITMEARSNSKVSGEATFIEKKGKVMLTAKLTGLKPGVHAIHIHEKSDCSAADGSSAGGHWNPTFKKHGKWGVGEYHKGDIGNFAANEDGEATVVFETNEWCIGCGDKTKDILGKSLVVHADPDDMVSQPSGNAGDRISCSAIIK
jgi:superoxide dismutase, Cu-Zn family